MERKIFNYLSEVLLQATIDRFGYNPNELGPTSSKFVIATCRYCGERMEIRKGFFNKSGSACHKECRLKEQSNSGSPFCDARIQAKAYKKRHQQKTASEKAVIAENISKGRKKAQPNIEKTNIELYGVKNVFQNSDIKNTIRDSHLAKRQVVHPMQDAEVSAKARETFKRNYVSANPNSIIAVLRNDAFWEELSKEGDSIADVCLKYGISSKDTTTMISRPEFRDKYYRTYTFPKNQKQNELTKLIEQTGLQVIRNSKILGSLELDIFVPRLRFAVEFNGNYWHSESCLGKSAKMKHRNKTDLCLSKGIRLLHVFEHQWDERKMQIMNLIKSILGINANRIAARKCLVTYDKASYFINDNHIQGDCPSIRYFNLVHDRQIIASMTASNHHRQNTDKKTVVLSRLCFLDNTTVQGGSSKLFSKFVAWAREQKYERIISWSDNCLTNGDIYRVLGFDLDREYGPDYFYWDIKAHRYHSKQSQQKRATNCPPGITEREWAMQRNLYRIWDAGKKTWVYNLCPNK